MSPEKLAIASIGFMLALVAYSWVKFYFWPEAEDQDETSK